MKKLLALLFVSCGLITSSFSLGLSAGVNGNFGSSFDAKSIASDGFSGGAGAYVNLDLLFGMGLQGEINYVTSPCKIVLPDNTIDKYKVLDLCLMPWYNLRLAFLSIGAGLGVNFAFYDQGISDVSNGSTNFIPGITFTANGKLLLGRHWGIVIGVHGVFDLKPLFDFDEVSASYLASNPNLTDFFRKSLYGTIGVEFRL